MQWVGVGRTLWCDLALVVEVALVADYREQHAVELAMAREHLDPVAHTLTRALHSRANDKYCTIHVYILVHLCTRVLADRTSDQD